MPADASFDVVSKVGQTAREIATRFDFKNTGASIRWSGEAGVEIEANAEQRAAAVLDLFQQKLVKRGVSLKSLDPGEPRESGKVVQISSTIKQGITAEDARKIAALVRAEGPKGVQARIQGDELRVTAKKRDDLQATIALLKAAELDIALQFVNYR